MLYPTELQAHIDLQRLTTNRFRKKAVLTADFDCRQAKPLHPMTKMGTIGPMKGGWASVAENLVKHANGVLLAPGQGGRQANSHRLDHYQPARGQGQGHWQHGSRSRRSLSTGIRDGRSFSEIGASLGISKQAAHKLSHAAITTLREKLETMGYSGLDTLGLLKSAPHRVSPTPVDDFPPCP
jgi:hypothetical protein